MAPKASCGRNMTEVNAEQKTEMLCTSSYFLFHNWNRCWKYILSYIIVIETGKWLYLFFLLIHRMEDASKAHGFWIDETSSGSILSSSTSLSISHVVSCFIVIEESSGYLVSSTTTAALIGDCWGANVAMRRWVRWACRGNATPDTPK